MSESKGHIPPRPLPHSAELVPPPKDPDGQQIGGEHYKKVPPEFQHWNLVVIHQWDYLQAQVIKYLMRWKDKGGVSDLQKAEHFLQKYIEVHKQFERPRETEIERRNRLHHESVKPGQYVYVDDSEPTRAYVDQGRDK